MNTIKCIYYFSYPFEVNYFLKVQLWYYHIVINTYILHTAVHTFIKIKNQENLLTWQAFFSFEN